MTYEPLDFLPIDLDSETNLNDQLELIKGHIYFSQQCFQINKFYISVTNSIPDAIPLPLSLFNIKEPYLSLIKDKLLSAAASTNEIPHLIRQMAYSMSFGKFSRTMNGTPLIHEDDYLYSINSMIKLFREGKWLNPIR